MLWYADPERAERAAFLDAVAGAAAGGGRSPRSRAATPGAASRRLRRLGESAACPPTRSTYRAGHPGGGRSVGRRAQSCPSSARSTSCTASATSVARRLYEAPVDDGLLDRPLDLAELNPDPHPFP